MRQLIRPLLAVACLSMAGAVFAKLPPPSEEAKAKAEEAKSKAAEGAKKDGELLGKAQDRTAERYIKEQKAKGKIVKPTAIAAAPAPAAAPVAAPAPAKPAAKK